MSENANGGTTLNTRHLLPISGYEEPFKTSPWCETTLSANCYSYAINHFLISDDKPQPGDVAVIYNNLAKNNNLRALSSSWVNCTDLHKRIVADGMATWRLLGFAGSGSTILPMSSPVPAAPKSHYKIMAVTTAGDSYAADYHFYKQNAMNLRDIYTCPIKGYTTSAFTGKDNPYQALGLDAFVSHNHLEAFETKSALGFRKDYDLISCKRDLDGMSVPKALARSWTNVKIHVDRIPEYVIRDGNFIVDPFWIMGVNPFAPSAGSLVREREGSLLGVLRGRDELAELTIQQAAKDCMAILSDRRKMPHKNMLIGNWSHKLGHATDPINTDGNGRLILDPRKARRKHGPGGLDYSSFCGAFAVMMGQGIATPPPQ